MRLRARVSLAALMVLVATVAGVFVLNARTAQFPHAEHASMFPLCGGCHEGIETGDMATAFPGPQLCARCHDGVTEPRVDWTAPTPHASNLDFTHPAHAGAVRAAGDAELDCAQCHTPAGAARMTVVRTDPAVCLACHGHQARDHFTDAPCSTCHVPFVESELQPAQLASLSRPADHDSPNFLLEGHGGDAQANVQRCAVCHTRERCTSCHVNAGAVAVIDSIPRAPVAWVMPQYEAHYPVPPSHQDPRWIEQHGAPASEGQCATCHTRESCTTCHVNARELTAITTLPQVAPGQRIPDYPAKYPVPASHREPNWLKQHGVASATQTCSTCHTRDDCEACHTSSPPAVVAGLPARSTVVAPGVANIRRMPPSHASRFFETDHSAIASSQPQTCAACHNQTFCTECHDAAARPSFHPRNFSAQHSSAAYGRRLECASCHEVQSFCRDCHVQSGMSAQERLNPGFHDAEPLWLLRHARAARQGLESCTSCHKQRDCLQCHSQLGAFKVSPHGPDFNARSAQRRNPVICFACHVTDPLSGGGTP